jgi:predicted component of type VI protein secretion system
MDELYELKEKLCKELKDYGSKELSAGSLSTIDSLAHTVKNLDKIIEAYEDEGNSGYYPYAYDDGMNRGGRSYNGSYRGRSYARRRDSMGRYSREGLADKMRDLMDEAPDERTRQEIQRMIEKFENN